MRPPGLVRLVLPLPPSVNDSLVPVVIGWRWRDSRGQERHSSKGGPAPCAGAEPVVRLVKTKEGRAFVRLVRSRAHTFALRPLPPGPIELHLTVYVPSLASDGGNRVKLLEDALKGLAIPDDKYLVVWRITKDIDPTAPRAEVVFRMADPAKHPRCAERIAHSARRERAEVRAGRREAARAAQLELVKGARAPRPPPLEPSRRELAGDPQALEPRTGSPRASFEAARRTDETPAERMRRLARPAYSGPARAGRSGQ